MTKQNEIFEKVAGKLVDAVLSGEGAKESWRKPWQALRSGWAPATAPLNLDRKAYRGINNAVLAFEAIEQGYDLGLPWATYKRWKAAKAQVRKGEKGTPVLFWKFDSVEEKNEETGETEKRSRVIVKGYTVFHAAQVDGWEGEKAWREKAGRPEGKPEDKPDAVQEWSTLEHVDMVVEDYKRRANLSIEYRAQDRAYYQPASHQVVMPTRAQFNGSGASGFFHTLLHELGHSTGHHTLLKREFGGSFGSTKYAIEEVTAEGCSAMLSGLLGVNEADHVDGQHLSYLNGWLKSIKRQDAAKQFTYAIQRAQKAAELIAGDAVKTEA